MRKLHKILAMVFAFAMSVSLLAVGAAAADVDLDQSDAVEVISDSAVPMSTGHPFGIGEDGKFVNVVRNPSGINRNVSIEVIEFLPGKYRMDIMEYGKNGLVWKEDDCLGNSYSRTFWCGPDVTDVYIRIVPRNVLFFPALPRDFAVIVTY